MLQCCKWLKQSVSATPSSTNANLGKNAIKPSHLSKGMIKVWLGPSDKPSGKPGKKGWEPLLYSINDYKKVLNTTDH